MTAQTLDYWENDSAPAPATVAAPDQTTTRKAAA